MSHYATVDTLQLYGAWSRPCSAQGPHRCWRLVSRCRQC